MRFRRAATRRLGPLFIRRLTRTQRWSTLKVWGVAVVEACVGAHHLSRKLGHDARLMPAKYVRPYSKGQKNDFRDAEAIAEAVQRPTMRFVATKTSEQLDLQVPEVNSDHEGTARNGTSR
jgi:transposase